MSKNIQRKEKIIEKKKKKKKNLPEIIERTNFFSLISNQSQTKTNWFALSTIKERERERFEIWDLREPKMKRPLWGQIKQSDLSDCLPLKLLSNLASNSKMHLYALHAFFYALYGQK